jgi:hypothetical protein
MKPFTRTIRLSLHCICDYRIISYSDFTSIVRSPFSILHSSSFSFSPRLSTLLGSSNLANLAGARLLGRLYETVGKGVTPPNSSGTEQDNNDESQSHQDPGDPSECLGGDDLVAVDQTVG